MRRFHQTKSECPRSGTIIVITALLITCVFAFAAFSIDVGFITLTRAQMQSAADASVLASAQELPQALGLGGSITSSQLPPKAWPDATTKIWGDWGFLEV